MGGFSQQRMIRLRHLRCLQDPDFLWSCHTSIERCFLPVIIEQFPSRPTYLIHFFGPANGQWQDIGKLFSYVHIPGSYINSRML
jgi:hypothetical protein